MNGVGPVEQQPVINKENTMEQLHQHHHTEAGSDVALDGYDAVPRDGPAVFVADTAKLDRGELHGRWIGLDRSAADIATHISAVTNRSPIDGGWAVIDQTRLLADAGVDYAVVTAPFYAPTQEADVEAHFRAVAKGSPLPVVAYDIPTAVHTKLSPDLVMRLASDGAIVAIKDSSAVQGQLRSLVVKNRAAGNPIKVFTGTEVVADADFLVGVDGMVPGLANVDPAGYIELYRLIKAGDWTAAARLQDRLAALFAIIHADQSLVGPAQAIGAFKEALRLRGVLATSATSAPLTLLSTEAKEEISRIVANHFGDKR